MKNITGMNPIRAKHINNIEKMKVWILWGGKGKNPNPIVIVVILEVLIRN